MFTSKVRHSLIAMSLIAVAGVAVAGASGFPAHRAAPSALPVAAGDLGEVVVIAPGDLGEVVVSVRRDLPEVLVRATRLPLDAPVLADVRTSGGPNDLGANEAHAASLAAGL